MNKTTVSHEQDSNQKPSTQYEFRVSDVVPEIAADSLGDKQHDSIETSGHSSQDEVVQIEFDSDLMQQLLDGDHAELRNEIRSLLQQPEFKRESIRDVAEYREKIYECCRL